MPDDIIDGEILEADAPRRLSLTWRMLMDPGMQAEGAGGGWAWVLSDLKSLLETGGSLAG